MSVFEETIFVWANDLRREALLSSIRPSSYLDNQDITANDRWMVLNWIREVFIAY